ncbi:Asp-tRNA(Asn)/Glu-tRNA(Gln) amidotransferase subunit GatC [Patescibacteria group bacterium]
MPKKLTKTEVEHVAKLARIDLTDKEKKKFQEQLGEVLDYIDKINEVDTENVEPTWQVTGLTNVMRPDRVDDYEQSKELIEAAPESEDNQVKVKSVFK